MTQEDQEFKDLLVTTWFINRPQTPLHPHRRIWNGCAMRGVREDRPVSSPVVAPKAESSSRTIPEQVDVVCSTASTC